VSVQPEFRRPNMVSGNGVMALSGGLQLPTRGSSGTPFSAGLPRGRAARRRLVLYRRFGERLSRGGRTERDVRGVPTLAYSVRLCR
jgi:hypothetical protein